MGPEQLPALAASLSGSVAPWLAALGFRKSISRLLGIPVEALELAAKGQLDKLRDRNLLAQERRLAIGRADNSTAISVAEELRDSSRAEKRVRAQAEREQENLDDVVRAAFEELSEGPPPSQEQPEVSDDFMSRFEKLAADASSERMRQLFGRVLAGEIRKPGTISLSALHIFSIMDTALASKIQRVAGWVTQMDSFPFATPLTGGEPLQIIGSLSDLGMVRFGFLEQTLHPSTQGFFDYITRERVFRLTPADRGSPMKVPSVLVSEVGSQVFSVVNPQLSHSDMIMLRDAMKVDSTNVASVQVFPLISFVPNGPYSWGPLPIA